MKRGNDVNGQVSIPDHNTSLITTKNGTFEVMQYTEWGAETWKPVKDPNTVNKGKHPAKSALRRGRDSVSALSDLPGTGAAQAGGKRVEGAEGRGSSLSRYPFLLFLLRLSTSLFLLFVAERCILM